MKDYGSHRLLVCRELLLKAPERIWLAMSRLQSISGREDVEEKKPRAQEPQKHEHLVAVKNEHI
jgi:hypothetical protein